MSVWDRIGALSGLIGGITVFASVSLADVAATGLEPDPTDPSAHLARAFIANRDRVRLGALVGLLGAFLMLFWVAFLYSKFREAEGPSGWFSNLVLAGGVVLVGLQLIEAGFAYAASELSDYRGDTQVAKVLLLWGWNSASLVAPGLAAIMAGAALLGLVSKALPPWLGWLSAASFGLLILIALVLGTPGLGAGVGMIWIVVVSIALATGPGLGTARR